MGGRRERLRDVEKPTFRGKARFLTSRPCEANFFSRSGRTEWILHMRARETTTPASGPALRLRDETVRYWRYCWMRVVRSPARPCCSIEYCHDRNSSTVSV